MLTEGRKVLVTCYWLRPLQLLQQALVDSGLLKVALLTGRDPAARRATVSAAVKAGEVDVVLLTSQSGVGFTFINLKTVFVLGVCLDVSAEMQAVARVVGRIGQDDSVRVVYVLSRATCPSTGRVLDTIPTILRT